MSQEQARINFLENFLQNEFGSLLFAAKDPTNTRKVFLNDYY